MMGDIINEMIDNFAKQQSRDMDDAIIRFLRSKGYKPRRTEEKEVIGNIYDNPELLGGNNGD